EGVGVRGACQERRPGGESPSPAALRAARPPGRGEGKEGVGRLRGQGRSANVPPLIRRVNESERMTEPPQKPRVGLLVTCLVDLIRPSIGFAAVKLIEDAGCTVEVPAQSCCGQPAFNSGDRATARAIAE